MSYQSEASKVRDMPHVMKFITGKILDLGCGPDKITPLALGLDGRPLPGVDFVISDPITCIANDVGDDYDTVFSSHFLEHLRDQFGALAEWRICLKTGGHLVLYLPCGTKYNNKENPEHMVDMKYEDFMFWFKRAFCGEGKDFRGNHMPKLFELIDHFTDYGVDRYSFVVIARKV